MALSVLVFGVLKV
jgi:hypothetical protein